MSEQQQVSVREELNNALIERTKQFVLEKLDEEILRRFLAESAAAELQRSISGWDLRKEIESAVRQRLSSEIPKVVDEILSEKESKSTLVASVRKAVTEGVKDGAARLKQRLANAFQGE